ncbi:MAG TPA: GNAT family N-acetyltransferase [Chlamydiales bacterium]|nr:GNAT family N-acetyltransferase [Chlamydiales bacterium]
MTSLPGFDIRFSEQNDLESLNQWFLIAGTCDDFPFGPDEKDEALKNWIGFSKFKASLTATLNGSPCAIGTLFLMPYKKVAHQCSFYLIVDPNERRKGIGFSMVRNLLHLAKTRFRLECIQVEIFDPSPLLSLLQKLNFQEFVRQENFLHVNGCSRARILMEHFFV